MLCRLIMIIAILLSGSLAVSADDSVTLKNSRLSAVFINGQLVQVTNAANGDTLMKSGSESAAGVAPFDSAQSLSLKDAKCSVRKTSKGLEASYTWPDGTRLVYNWTLEKSGDLVLKAQATSPKPVDISRIAFNRCDLANHNLVYVTNFGVGATVKAPFSAVLIGDEGQWRKRYMMPLVTLLEGKDCGFVMEGRDLRVGPSTIHFFGKGESTDVVFVRYSGDPVSKHDMYEIRIRAYTGSWHAAIDPYVKWMEKGLGFVPWEKKSPAWVKDVRGQFYNDPNWDPKGAAKLLDDTAKTVTPSKTLLGKVSEYRNPKWGFDHGWGDYSFNEGNKQFFQHAKKLGFHVAAHINASGVELDLPELIAKFRPGLLEVGKDDKGNPKYMGYNGEWSNVYGPVRFAWCSLAYKPWREHVIAQIKPLVEAGVDAIYFDENHTPLGNFVVDGMTGIEGVMQLQRDVRKAYPNLAIMTEQFNLMCSRYASFGLTSHDLGHPISGYIFQRFIRVASWGVAINDPKVRDFYWRWGGNRLQSLFGDQESLEIANAFECYALDPAYELPLAPNQLSAYTGKNGVKAYYEKNADKEGLVVYAKDQELKWFGVRQIEVSNR